MLEKDQAVLAEVREVNAEIRKDAGEIRKNSCGKELLKEHLSDFSTTGMLFAEVTADMMAETEDLFTLSGCCDRFSPQYLKICKTLTKAVDHLGGAYLTKAALIDRELPVTGLETLTAERLNEMMSFNFRKCKGALDEIKMTRQVFDLDLFSQMLSCANVMERLRSTQYRALGMHFGALKFNHIAERSLSFGKTGSNRPFEGKDSTNPPFRQTPSYAPDYAVLAQVDLEQQTAVSSDMNAEQGVKSPKSLPAPVAETGNDIPEKDELSSDENTAGLPAAEVKVQEEILQNDVTEAEESLEKPFGDEELELGNLKHITEPAAYLDILQRGNARAVMNKANDDSGSGPAFIFTEDEIVTLLNDREFVRNRPGMAEELRLQLEILSG